MNRQTPLARSTARTSLLEILTEDEFLTHDIESIVTEAVEAGMNVKDLGATELATLLAPHEFDGYGDTAAALERALTRSQTGWVAMIRRPDEEDVQTLNLKYAAGDTHETIEAALREFIIFPEGTSVMILPLVG